MCSQGMYEHYEPRFWGLDPVFCTRVKLNIGDVMSLQSHPNFPDVLCFLNHPIQSVHIMGDIVSVKQKSRLMEYKVDDGTGVMSCTQWRLVEDSDEGITILELGDLVSVWGKLSEFRNEKQLTVTSIVQQKDPNAEPLHWLEVVHLKRTVYSRPFLLPRGVLGIAEDSSGAMEFSRHVLHRCILSHLKASYSCGHFTLKELAKEEALLKTCRENVELSEWAEEELAKEMDLLVRDLPAEGIVIPAIGVGVQRMEVKYEVLNTRKHLCPVILGYVQGKERQSKSAVRLGIPENWIIQFVKQKEAFQLLPSHLVTEGIEVLVGDSIIYDYGNKNYKTVT